MRRIKAAGRARCLIQAGTVDGPIMDSVSLIGFGRIEPFRRQSFQIGGRLGGPHEGLRESLLRRGQVRGNAGQLERGRLAVTVLEDPDPHLLERGVDAALSRLHSLGRVHQLAVYRADPFFEGAPRRDHLLLCLIRFGPQPLVVPRPRSEADRNAER